MKIIYLFTQCRCSEYVLGIGNYAQCGYVGTNRVWSLWGRKIRKSTISRQCEGNCNRDLFKEYSIRQLLIPKTPGNKFREGRDQGQSSDPQLNS